jgi:hypothetical protein
LARLTARHAAVVGTAIPELAVVIGDALVPARSEDAGKRRRAFGIVRARLTARRIRLALGSLELSVLHFLRLGARRGHAELFEPAIARSSATVAAAAIGSAHLLSVALAVVDTVLLVPELTHPIGSVGLDAQEARVAVLARLALDMTAPERTDELPLAIGVDQASLRDLGGGHFVRGVVGTAGARTENRDQRETKTQTHP